jgi:hypothetical protein
VHFVVENDADSVLFSVRTSNTQLLNVARRDPATKYLKLFCWKTELVSVSDECTSRMPLWQELLTSDAHEMSPPRMSADR